MEFLWRLLSFFVLLSGAENTPQGPKDSSRQATWHESISTTSKPLHNQMPRPQVLVLTEKQYEQVGDGEREQVVVCGRAHAGDPQNDAADAQVAEDAGDRHH